MPSRLRRLSCLTDTGDGHSPHDHHEGGTNPDRGCDTVRGSMLLADTPRLTLECRRIGAADLPLEIWPVVDETTDRPAVTWAWAWASEPWAKSGSWLKEVPGEQLLIKRGECPLPRLLV